MSRQPVRPLSVYTLFCGIREYRKKSKKIEKKACVSGNVCYSETEGKEEYSRRRVRSSAAERRVERRMQKPEMFSGNAQEAIMENPPESKARKGRKDNKS